MLAPELPPLNELRAGLGLQPLHRFDDQFLTSDRFIAFTAEPYEIPPTRLAATGAPRGARPTEPPADPPAWLEAESRPIVFVTASTAFQLDAKLIATALQVLPGENMAVVATTAAHSPAEFDAPVNAHRDRFLPHGRILTRAACVVCHG